VTRTGRPKPPNPLAVGSRCFAGCMRAAASLPTRIWHLKAAEDGTLLRCAKCNRGFLPSTPNVREGCGVVSFHRQS
jgi:hypothetical protein